MSADAKFALALFAGAVVVILYRIYEKVKAIHFIMLNDFKRRRPDVFDD